MVSSGHGTTCGSVDFRHLWLSSTIIGASEVDSSTRVSWMLLRCAATSASTGSNRGRGVEATRNHNNTLQNPLTVQMGDERIHWLGRVSIHVLSSQSRNVQPLSYEPEYSLLISSETRITVQSPSTEVLANRLIGTCARCNPLQNTTSPVHCVPRLSHWSTIPQVLPPMNSFVLKTNFSHNLLGLTSVGWSSLRLS